MSKQYYIELNGHRIPVTEEVYYAFKRPVWKEIKSRRIRNKNELSFDWLADNGFEIPSDEKPIDEVVEEKLMLDMLYKALSELTDEEHALIDALYFKDQSAREYARINNTNHTNINRRHKIIIEKLRNILKNNVTVK